jgi:hypothetical protein
MKYNFITAIPNPYYGKKLIKNLNGVYQYHEFHDIIIYSDDYINIHETYICGTIIGSLFENIIIRDFISPNEK